ncbi:MAG TPA: DUF6265 family protein [Bacteroidia bacterium]|nr:DUF6265 family protein [Bacteroidia bacterium]
MKKIIFFAFCLLSFSCGNKTVGIADFTWLQGKWMGTSEGMDFFEQWKPLQGNLLDGQGGAVSGKDTVFSEKIKIEQRGEDVFYTANVQENGGPVDFKFTGYKQDSIVFENPKHDFPQRLVYFRLPNNKLYACIDGLKAGKYSRMEFSYQKAE